MSLVHTYRATHEGHEIALEFDQRRIVLNEARLLVDGNQVDKTKVFYGEKDLTATLDDGTAVTVRLMSGMVGEINRPQVRFADAPWQDLVEA